MSQKLTSNPLTDDELAILCDRYLGDQTLKSDDALANCYAYLCGAVSTVMDSWQYRFLAHRLYRERDTVGRLLLERDALPVEARR